MSKFLYNISMRRMCKSLKDLSLQGYWDDVFSCLSIDENSTIELANLKIPEQPNDLWLDDHKATLNSLEVILGVILLCDQIFYFLLLLYLLLFIVKFVRLHVFSILKTCCSYMKKYKCRKQEQIAINCKHDK